MKHFSKVRFVAIVVTVGSLSAIRVSASLAASVSTTKPVVSKKAAAKKPSSKKPPAKKAPTKKPVDPNAPEVVAPGDIPDNQVFIPYRPKSGAYTINVPEGWPRTENNGAVTFSDKYNSIGVTSGSVAAAPTVESVGNSGLADVSSDPTYRPGTVAVVKTAGGPAIKATYEIGSAANSVTGKKALLAVERYVYFANGTQVVVTLSGAKGADNVDPWKIVSDSVRVG
jgi:hypothetical protein